jgi:hypothetical protein
MIAPSCAFEYHEWTSESEHGETVMQCPRGGEGDKYHAGAVKAVSHKCHWLSRLPFSISTGVVDGRGRGCGHLALFIAGGRVKGSVVPHSTTRLVFLRLRLLSCPLALLLLGTPLTNKEISLLHPRPFRTLVTLLRLGVPLPLEIVIRSSIPAESHRKPLARAPTPNQPTESGHLFQTPASNSFYDLYRVKGINLGAPALPSD